MVEELTTTAEPPPITVEIADNPETSTTEQSVKQSAKGAADATNRTAMRWYADPI